MIKAKPTILWKMCWGSCLGSCVGIIVLFWLVTNQPDAWAKSAVNPNWALGVLVSLFLFSFIAAVLIKSAEKSADKSNPP